MTASADPFGFLVRCVVVGLALAFVVVLIEPGLLAPRGAPPGPATAAAPRSYAEAVARAAPAVVNVHSLRAFAGDATPDAMAQRFDGRGTDAVEESLGSGVIVRADGYILTNHHVIADAQDINVLLADGRSTRATVVGTDPETDLALLKIEFTGLPVASLAPVQEARVGDVVLAIGNPFGLGQTVTQGIISAIGRSDLGLSTFENFIQTDAAINFGNSGGALVDARGELVGINTAKFQLNGQGSGIGFAVPVSLARGVTEQLISHGRVLRGWLGVDPQTFTPQLAEAFGIEYRPGILVKRVHPGSPAEAAGLRTGDIITHIDGQPVLNYREALNRIAGLAPGSDVALAGMREGGPLSVTAKVAERRNRSAG
jgi:Do/DeqQ family serine protease